MRFGFLSSSRRLSPLPDPQKPWIQPYSVKMEPKERERIPHLTIPFPFIPPWIPNNPSLLFLPLPDFPSIESCPSQLPPPPQAPHAQTSEPLPDMAKNNKPTNPSL